MGSPTLTTLRGTPAYSAGKFGNALSGGVLAASSAGEWDSPVGTLEAWVKTSTSALKVAVGSQGDNSVGGTWIGTSASGNATCQTGSTSGTSSIFIADNAWHHLALTVDGTTWKLWVDGALGASFASTAQFRMGAASGLGQPAIGGYGGNSGYDWPGQIDEVRVSNSVRYTATFTPPAAAFVVDPNTRALYHLESSGLNEVAAGPVASWDFDGSPHYKSVWASLAPAPETALNGFMGGTWWANSGAGSAWIAATLRDAPGPLTQYSFQCRPDAAYRVPKTWTFEGSNDATTWTVLDTRTNITWTAGETKTFTFTNTTTWAAYRLNVSAAAGTDGVSTSNLVFGTMPRPRELDAVNGVAIAFEAASAAELPTPVAPGRSGSGRAIVSPAGAASYRARVASQPFMNSNTLSLEAWVKAGSNSGGSIFDRDNESVRVFQVVNTSTDGAVNVIWWTTGGVVHNLLTGAGTVPMNTWTHLVVSFDGTTVRVISNGVTVASAAQSGTLVVGACDLALGAHQPTYNQVFQGSIDSVRFYTYGMTDTEANARMLGPSAVSGPASLSDKRLWLRAKDLGANGSSVTSWVDQSGLSHNPASAGTTPPTVATGSTPAGGKAASFSDAVASGWMTVASPMGGSLTSPVASTEVGGFGASKAFDGARGTCWAATTSTGWLRFQSPPGAAAATSYSVMAYNSATQAPATWTFEGSNDGSSWTTLDTRTGVTFTAFELKTYTISNYTAWAYYRLNVTANGGSTNLAVAELSIDNLGVPTEAEMWMVVKANSGDQGSPLDVSRESLESYYTYGGVVYDGFGGTRQSFTPTLGVTSWRLFRATRNASTREWFLDSASQLSTSAGILQWTDTGVIGAATTSSSIIRQFNGKIAEIFVRGKVSTSAEVIDLIDYFNTEHGLSVPGGSPQSAALTASSTLTATATTAAAPSVATLTASSTLTATAVRTKFASAALVSTSVLAADGYIGVPTYSGTVAMTAHAVLTAAAAAGRLASATLTSSSALKATAQFTEIQAIATLSATMVLRANPEPPKEHMCFAALYAASALFVDADASTSATVALTASSSLSVTGTAFTPFTEPIDPRTGRPQYRLVIAHRDGERFAELTNATVSAIESGVGVGSSFNFEAPTSDWKLAYVKRAGRQAQVWRGTDLEFRGPIVTIDEAQEGGVTTVKCRDPFWYLESGRRVIGAIPKRDILVNGSFATGSEVPWQGGFAPDSIPKAQPVRDIVDVDFFGTPMKALQISGVDKVVTITKELKTAAVFVPNSAAYLPGGESQIKAVAALMPKTGNLTVDVKGYTADNRINGDPGDGMELSKARAVAAAATIRAVRPNAKTTTAGYGYYYQVPGGLDANRRVVVSWSGVEEASGHRQYEVQTLTVSQPTAKKAPLPLTFVGWTKITKWLGPSKDGWAVYIQLVNPSKPKVIVDSAHADIDEKTPRNRWLRMEATVEVPADGIDYEVQVRFYPPAGTALWTRGGLYPGDQLGFFDVDQALIIKGLVEHAQDTSIGKGNLDIGTRCQATGIVRTREYPYDERMPIDTAINEIATLFRGPEVVMEVTATTQTVVTYHPRQGKRTTEVLVHGGNVVAYEAPTDNREAASSIILQADGFGADREEGYARDWVALDGLMLERVVSTEGDTPVTELEEGAVKALSRLKNPQPAVWVTIDPDRTSEVRDKIGQGDYVRLIIEDAGIDGTYRYVKRRLHPGTDILELMLTPEED